MAVRQITVRLPAKTASSFTAYAAKFSLNASQLARLLIIREKYLRRLEELARLGNETETSIPPARSQSQLRSITAHMQTVRHVREFDKYAKRCGLSRDRAGALLLEAELREQWLLTSIRRQ